MANDDEAARLAKANAVRERIAALKSGQAKPEDSENDSKTSSPLNDPKPANDTTPVNERPREFVHRRMRELDHDPSKNDASDD
ncbi:MAG TPA: hypothetical protein VGO73_14530 [Pyrinomonadaceae bacterium]|jgi:hypothetical protein|nr:hypothetical protein [Pyrinomonadaceae bacterium]